jgi:phenylacetate-CoA ligase
VPWIHNHIFLPLFEPERHIGLADRIEGFEQFDAASWDRQMLAQSERVRRLLDHAYNTTPYYRRLFDEVGFRAADWSPGDSIPVPLLSRDRLRTFNDELRSRRYRIEDLRSAATGGTTSTPVQFWRDIEGLRMKTALQFHLNRQSGFDQGDRVMMIWGAERDLALNPSWRWRFYEQTLMRRYTAAAGQIGETIFAGFLEKLNRHRPKVIYGYASTVARFAEYLTERRLAHFNPQRVFVTAEPLTDEDRQIIETCFGVPLTEQYGSRDIGLVASQCEYHLGLHFHPAACYVEYLPAGETPEGPMYRLVVTDLLNYGMPLIRYDTEDCVTLADTPCPCGRRYPSVRRVIGRVVDNFLLADGTQISGTAIATIMARMSKGFQSVRQVQLVQKELDLFHLRYSAQGDELYIEQELARFRAAVEELLRAKLRWVPTRVPEILRERSGKLRLCISEVIRDRRQSA